MKLKNQDLEVLGNYKRLLRSAGFFEDLSPKILNVLVFYDAYEFYKGGNLMFFLTD